MNRFDKLLLTLPYGECEANTEAIAASVTAREFPSLAWDSLLSALSPYIAFSHASWALQDLHLSDGNSHQGEPKANACFLNRESPNRAIGGAQSILSLSPDLTIWTAYPSCYLLLIQPMRVLAS